MIKEVYFKYSDDRLEAYRKNDSVVIYDKTSKKYFLIDHWSHRRDFDWIRIETRFLFFAPLFMFGIIVCALIYAVFMARSQHVPINQGKFVPEVLACLALYGMGQVVIHELSHIGALRLFGYSHDSWGFALELGFWPTIFVRVNKVLLLPTSQRLVVHLAGVFSNAVVNLLLMILATIYQAPTVVLVCLCLYSVGIFVNTLPIFGSDGYKCLMVVLDIWEKRAEANGLAIFIKIVSIGLAAIYSIYILLQFITMGLLGR